MQGVALATPVFMGGGWNPRKTYAYALGREKLRKIMGRWIFLPG